MVTRSMCIPVPIPMHVRVPPCRLLLSRPQAFARYLLCSDLACALPLRPLYRLHKSVHKFNHAYHRMHCNNSSKLTASPPESLRVSLEVSDPTFHATLWSLSSVIIYFGRLSHAGAYQSSAVPPRS